MHDEFLHRLRKEPRPEFAARLRSHLRRLPTSPPPTRVLSRARTLLTLLLLGGTAFAVTSVVIRGLPRPVIELYQFSIARIGAWHFGSSTHRVGNEGFLAGLRWGAGWASPQRGAAARNGTAHSAAVATSARGSPGSAGAASRGSARVVGNPFGFQQSKITVLTSWAAYPHVEEVANRLYIDVAAGNSAVWRDWPQTMCSGKPSAPAMAFTYEPVGTVSTRPCPPDLLHGNPIIAVPLGYEAVALARSSLYGALDLTRREVFLALAKWVPDPARPGTVHENRSTVWRQIDPAQLPEPIQIMGPPLSSATGRSMIELLMEGGCNTYPWIAALKVTAPDKYAHICRTVRTDGVYSETSPQASELLEQPNALGILGFGDLMSDPALGNLAVSRLDGVTPTQQDVESGTYPGSRGVYLYVNRSRIANTPPFFFPFPRSDGALVPLPDAQRQAAIEALF